MYTRTVTVGPSKASCRGQIKLRGLLDLFQDTAEMAVEKLEGTSTELMSRGYSWILTRYEVEFMGALPMLDEKFLINTYHDPSHGYNMLRVFDVTKPDGTPIIWAKTSWLLMDLAAYRAVRPIEHIQNIADDYTGEIAPDFRAIPDIPDITVNPDRPDVLTVPWTVRFHDLDANGHVNNAVYFEWLFEATIAAAKLDPMAWDLKSVAGTFRSSVKLGDNVKILISELEPSQDHATEKDTRTFAYRILSENPNLDAQAQAQARAKSLKKSGTVFTCTWKKISS